VIGKFYPPHKGHHFLIDVAQTKVDELTVIVCDHPDQKISAQLRSEWLREIHPNVTVLTTPDDLPDEPQPWAERTIALLGKRPDFVFTSEQYGQNYAKAMNAEHVCVDAPRSQVPISATKIRLAPYAHWEYLSPPVREYFALRVVLVGVESTGKTTLAAELAKELETVWVEEYGREYAERKVASDDPAWATHDFVAIAQEQQRKENLQARSANQVLICDTNAFVTGVWHERYLEHRSPEVDAISVRDKVDLYLLTIPDFPFVQDGTRDGEHIRDWMHERFLARLVETQVPVVTLDGSHERRVRKALDEIEKLLTNTRRAT